MNNKQPVLYGVIGLLLGIIIAWAAATAAVNGNHNGMMHAMGMHNTTNGQGMMHDGDMTMGQMTSDLQSKTGDDFDKAYLSEMIMHHQGAIDMSKLAQDSAKHQEVKDLANNIITAQNKEIGQMKTWQNQWGYTSGTDDSGSHMMMH